MTRSNRTHRAVRSAALSAITWFPDFRCERHRRYDGFVPTMMHPYLFEDPFITTGVRVPINKHLILGAAYEIPLTDREDVLNQRASGNATLEF